MRTLAKNYVDKGKRKCETGPMPRQARLDAPSVLHHIMIRGIERRKIFRDKKDREDFLERLAKFLLETKTACYAWVFIPNHPFSVQNRNCFAGHVDEESAYGVCSQFQSSP
jgi:hypothetical protein